MTRLLCVTDLLPKTECAIDRAGILAQGIDAQRIGPDRESRATDSRNDNSR
jgi:hypothetical protein